MQIKKYDHKKIEGSWQKKWEKAKLFKTEKFGKKPKSYTLDFFPYPSGEGLHIGHPKGYTATDIYSRFKKMSGHSVLHPMGWDAFGLPAENYAIKMKIHPEAAVKKNIKRFKEQLKKIGYSYDWEREISTTDPAYYRWTQWIFLQMMKKGLAYESYEPINWCPSCQTGLANEDLEGDACERCGTVVEKKPMRQWVLRITDYAEKMLKGLDTLSWPNSVKELQRNWIGKSEGTIVKFKIQSSNVKTADQNSKFIEVFTTRIDTIFGCTYVVVAPEHELLKDNKIGAKNFTEIKKYIEESKNRPEMERVAEKREKTGIKLEGVTAINPFNKEEVTVWVADYVLGGYGTGAVMAVPAHDERDYEFAKKHGLRIKKTIEPITGEPKENEEFRRSIVALVENKKTGKILSLNWGPQLGGYLFIGGGRNECEDIVECAKREIAEETGYKNIKLIGTTEKIHHHYFAFSKNVHRCIEANGVHFELIDEENSGQKLEENEKNKFKVEWITKEEAAQRVTDSLHHYIFDQFIDGKIYTKDGVLSDSGEFTNLTSAEARRKMADWLTENKFGGRKISYKIKDWVFSRQRYWGEPIPVIHCEKCALSNPAGRGIVPVPEKDLPVLLPKVKSYAPTGTGESPLAAIVKWVNTKCPKCKGPAKRETNTMPNWAGSCWYYLRFIDPKNKKELIGKKEGKNWMPVDMYVGGAEHATRHLIYARFWHKFLYDIGVVSHDEPFSKLHSVGLVLAGDGRKMSKRWGNVINPDEMVKTYGADTFRLYEMFMGPFDQAAAWKTENMIGARRFVEKIWRMQFKTAKKPFIEEKELEKLESSLHETIKKVSEDIDNFGFNTAISAMMIFSNDLEKFEVIPQKIYEDFVLLLSPFAPHITDEIWHNLGHKKFIYSENWPKFDPAKIKKAEYKLIVQINGKVRDGMVADIGIDEAKAKELALKSPMVNKHLEGKEIKKTIFVKDRLINFVV